MRALWNVWLSAFIFLWCSCSSTHAANNYNCNGPLLSVLPQSSFKGSTSSNGQFPHLAKLNNEEGEGGWAPRRSDKQHWLQVDLLGRVEVTGIATQGRAGSSDWVTRYMLLFSDLGQAWRQYRQEDDTVTFPGNTNSDAVVPHKLPVSIRARFLRFVPLKWSRGGGIGLRAEVYGCAYKSDVVDFNSRSALLYRFNQKSMSTVKDRISLKFKSQGADGVLVHGAGQRGDYLTLELHQGTLVLHLNLDDEKLYPGSGNLSVSVGSLLDDQGWHSVLMERVNTHVNLTVDRLTRHSSTTGVANSLEVDYELSFGGIPLPGKPGTFLRKNFHGCIENLFYNGVNIIDLAKRRKPQMYSVGNVSFSCSEPQLYSTSFLSTSSFLSLPVEPGMEGLSVRFQFRTWNQEGLLLLTVLSGSSKLLFLHISRGQLHLTLQRLAVQKSDIAISHSVSDGQWHSVRLSLRDLKVSLTLDAGPVSTMEVQNHVDPDKSIFFGGCPSLVTSQGCRNPTLAFQGCLRQITINGQPVNMSFVQQGIWGNYSQIHFDICEIRDRCLPNNCEHDGQCSQTWNTFYCDCSGTGYTGATCHNSIYEASCEAHRRSTGLSGYFSIDPDGSGPLSSTLVYCNMTGDRAWTVVVHNSTGPVSVQGSSLQGPHVRMFHYTASPQQMLSLVGRSELCQQEVVYGCRKSPLFNAFDGTPVSWWLDRDGERRTYWAGFQPGIQQCSCSLEENCIDTNFFCNCDADRDSWATDTGLVSFKDHLPMTGMVVGDTHRTGSLVTYRVGPLQCSGDRFLWNAAWVYEGSSYLSFPSFQAELSADISFYFKTSSYSGVFLENLGRTDFIRLDMTSPTAIAFLFDVGNGPVVLTVRSPVPLNDRQWHYVRVERNVKEATLQVDQLPPQSLGAPSDGFYRLQLSSPLFIGGTASRQSSFVGCIRALTMNGVPLDLEERARKSPGVRPGCPGNCGGQEHHCHNRGRCIEKDRGFVCDCTHSAYGGPHCEKEVSVSFESGSSVTYRLQEPSSVMDSRGSQSTDKNGDSITFRFRTVHAPAMLLFVSSFNQKYMAIILATNGSLQIRDQWAREKTSDVFSHQTTSLADGMFHHVQIHRDRRDLDIQIDDDITQRFSLSSDAEMTRHTSLTLGKVMGLPGVDEEVLRAGSSGFIGCLSSVQFNHLAPLKAAILNRGSSLVSIQGNMVDSNCGALANVTTSHSIYDLSDSGVHGDKERRNNPEHNGSALVGGIIAAASGVIVCAVTLTTRIVYQRCHCAQDKQSVTQKEACPNLDTRNPEGYPANIDLDLGPDLHLDMDLDIDTRLDPCLNLSHNSSRIDNKREYLI
ncbi:contactin-associated protein-like 5 [Osmerus mordax]|uniref:contactin-associated protein-like 5 n=1 Tax=Osmerus mordax TaxID=8014 RepID=UPI00350FF32E